MAGVSTYRHSWQDVSKQIIKNCVRKTQITHDVEDINHSHSSNTRIRMEIINY